MGAPEARPALRVLLVAPRFHPSTGGVETHVRELARRLPMLGIDARVLTTDATGGHLPPEEIVDGILVRRVRAWPTGRDWLLAPGMPAAIRAAGADVVHVHSFQTAVAPAAIVTAAHGRIPYLLTFHRGGHRTGVARVLPALELLALAPFLRRAAGLVAVSRYEAAVAAGAIGMARRRIAVIPNGAELPPPSSGVVPDDDLLLSVGRLEPYKGHASAIAALGVLVASGKWSRLTILGSGPDEPRLRRLAAAAGVSHRVTITSIPGWDRQAYTDQLASAGCVLVLSRYESQGIAAWEAAGLGRPLVVAGTTALRELAEAGGAIAVSPDADGPSIADAVQRAQAAGPNRIEVPTWGACAAELAARYRVAGGSSGG